MEKGVSLTIHTAIIIVLAILVLAIIAFFFITGTNPLTAMKYQSAFDRGCKIHLETGKKVDSILVDDLDGDGKPNTLLEACRLYFADSTLTPENCSEKCKQKFLFGFNVSGNGASGIPGDRLALGEICTANSDCASNRCDYKPDCDRSSRCSPFNPWGSGHPCSCRSGEGCYGDYCDDPHRNSCCNYNCDSGKCDIPGNTLVGTCS